MTSFLSASHRHDAANRLLEDDRFTYTYDANGNRVRKTDKTTLATTTYTYDVENQLIRVNLPDDRMVQYRYDGLGRRIEKSLVSGLLSPVSTTRYLYDEEDIVGIFTGPTNCQTHVFLHGPGIDQPLAFLRDTNTDCNPFTDGAGFREPIIDLLGDGLGSRVAVTSETHGFFRAVFLAERYAYDSFGTPRITGPGPDNQLDTGDDVTPPISVDGLDGNQWLSRLLVQKSAWEIFTDARYARYFTAALRGRQPYVVQQVARIATDTFPLLIGDGVRWTERCVVSGFFFSSSAIGLIGRFSGLPVVNVSRGGGLIPALWIHP